MPRTSRESARRPARPSAARAEPPPSAATGRPDPALLAILLAGLGLWVFFLLHTHLVLEDALITYRYAENVARGTGFVFNPGERVLGTTTPLLTLLLAGFGALFGVARIPLLSNLLMLGAALATGWLLHDIVRRSGGPRVAALAAATLWVLHPDTLWTTTGGMETPLVLLLMAAGLDLALRERWNRAAVATGLLVLARPDGLIWALLLLVAAVVRLRGRVLRPVLAALAAVLPWVVFAWLYFGSPVPHAVVAKQEVVFRGEAIQYLLWLLNSLGFGFVGEAVPIPFALWAAFVLIGTATVLFGRGLPGPLRAAGLFPGLFIGALAWGRAPYFDWYVVPVTWCCLLLGVLGATRTFAALRRLVKHPAWRRVALPVVVVACVLVLAQSLLARDWSAFRYWRQFQENEDGTRARIGDWLREHTRPGAVLAMEAIGYQATRSRRRVVDFAGLVSPAVVTIHRESRSNAEVFDRILRTYAPEAVVLRRFEVERNLHYHGGPLFETDEQRSGFLAAYERALDVAAPHVEIWGQDGFLTVWRRR